MPLFFKARVLLELGAELISSDAVALYELIKNAIDAGSKKVKIEISIAMQPSAYRMLKEEVEDIADAKWNNEWFQCTLLERMERSASNAHRDAFLADVGRPSSSADAIQAVRDALFAHNKLQVIDLGHGMDDTGLRDGYLTVGTPSRLKDKARILRSREQAARSTPDRKTTLNGDTERLPLGEKGIGRLAAMRIGHYVHVYTCTQEKARGFELELDWRPVFEDYELDAGDLQFNPTEVPGKKRFDAGTIITIRDIQSDWTIDGLKNLADSDLGKLADPFKANFANQFLTIIFQGSEQALITGFQESNLKYADAECTISYRAGPVCGDGDLNNAARLQVSTEYRRFKKTETLLHTCEHLSACVTHPPGRRPRGKASDPLPQSDEVIVALKTLGDFEAKFFWFNRGRLIKEHNELWQSTLQRFVRNWSGGLLVYRDGFRVYPYGSAADDWLDLDRKALASSAFKLNRAQIVGYLRISSLTNQSLQDQTNREGFRDCPEKEALRRLLRHAIIADCKTLLERVDKQNKVADEETIRDIDERIVDSNQTAVSNLRSLQTRVPEEADSIQRVLAELAEVQDAWSRAKEALKAQESDVEQYVHLAGVGLMVELLAHEMARSTDAAIELLHDKRLARDPKKLEMLEAQLKTLNKRVRVIDELSIPGRQRKAIHDITGLVRLMKEFYETKLARHGVEFWIEVQPKGSFSRRVEKGQILQIVDNLLSNSMYWLVRRLDRKQPPAIRAVLDPVSGTMRFTDSGPGIPESIGDKVFDPFYTTKPAGDGRGLGLYIAQRLARANNGEIELLPAESGRHPGFVLRFAAK